MVPVTSAHWRINAAALGGWAYATANWTATGLGGALATFAVAGFTGLIRTE